ncbi:hypothetical protein BDW22DRAFT_1348067 [Trametopsis cervina]|nr:hypothetical protein BDW22DRAFT_1348067 [Trametopsis cervina]
MSRRVENWSPEDFDNNTNFILDGAYKSVFANYVVVSVCVLWMVDYLETLPVEDEAFLSSRDNLKKPYYKTLLSKLVRTQGLFFINRYGFLLYTTMKLWYTTPGDASNRACRIVGLWMSVLVELTTISTCNIYPLIVLLVLRAYAICKQSRLVLAIGVLLVMARLGSGVYTSFGMEEDARNYIHTDGLYVSKCYPRILDIRKTELLSRLQAVTQCCTLVLDVFVFIVVACAVLRQMLDMRRHRQASITQLIIRDAQSSSLWRALLQQTYKYSTRVPQCLSPKANYYTSQPPCTLCMLPLLPNTHFETNSHAFALRSLSLPNMLVNRLVLNLRTYSDQPDSLPTTGYIQSALPGPADETSSPPVVAYHHDEGQPEVGVPWEPTGEIEVVPR